MRRIKQLIYNDKTISNERKINDILETNDLHWLIDSEIEDASIEIKHKTLIWHSGDFYSGNWHYGIFKNGNFFGIWENGIFEDGNFKGRFISGIKIKT